MFFALETGCDREGWSVEAWYNVVTTDEAKGAGMPATEYLKVRLTREEKDELQARCDMKGTTVSDEVRSALGLGRPARTPLETLDLALELAESMSQMSGLPSMSDEEVVAYCAAVRRERAQEVMGAVRA